jgi:hypothetical protein
LPWRVTQRSQLGYVFAVDVMTSRHMRPIIGMRVSVSGVRQGRCSLRIWVCVAMVVIVLASVS